jgi:hypothetical protein
MKIKFKKDVTGFPDGIREKEYKTGKTYDCPLDVSKFLVDAWVKKGVCEIVKKEPVKPITKAPNPKNNK